MPAGNLSPVAAFDASSSAVRTAAVTRSAFPLGRGRIWSPDVSTPAPGPGWWLASDGKWYPQRWESTFISHTHESLQTVLEEANRLTKAYGEQGWAIAGSSVQRTEVAHRFKEYDRGGDHYFEWSLVCTLKRPLPPAPARLPRRSRSSPKTGPLTTISSKGDF
jgi:hypothetical protein